MQIIDKTTKCWFVHQTSVIIVSGLKFNSNLLYSKVLLLFYSKLFFIKTRFKILKIVIYNNHFSFKYFFDYNSYIMYDIFYEKTGLLLKRLFKTQIVYQVC